MAVEVSEEGAHVMWWVTLDPQSPHDAHSVFASASVFRISQDFRPFPSSFWETSAFPNKSCSSFMTSSWNFWPLLFQVFFWIPAIFFFPAISDSLNYLFTRSTSYPLFGSFTHVSIYPSICPFVILHLSIHPLTHLSIHLSILTSIPPSSKYLLSTYCVVAHFKILEIKWGENISTWLLPLCSLWSGKLLGHGVYMCLCVCIGDR